MERGCEKRTMSRECEAFSVWWLSYCDGKCSYSLTQLWNSHSLAWSCDMEIGSYLHACNALYFLIMDEMAVKQQAEWDAIKYHGYVDMEVD